MTIQQEIMNRIDSLGPDLVKLCQSLIRIPSVNPPGNEGEVAEFIQNRLSALGLKVVLHEQEPGRLNVEARLGDSEEIPAILFNGHTDVVSVKPEEWTTEPFGGEVRGERLYGRGSADMKGALASMIIALQAVVEANVSLKRDVAFHAVIDEEIGETGTPFMIRKGLVRARMAVNGELSTFSNRVHIRPVCSGIARLHLESYEDTGSRSRQRPESDPVANMARLMNNLTSVKWTNRKHSLFPTPRVTFTSVRTEETSSRIPECHVDARIFPVTGSMTKREAQKRITSEIRRLKDRDPQFRARADIWWSDGAEISEASEVMQIAQRASRVVFGKKIPVSPGLGANDSRFIINDAKIPTICGFGPGDYELGNAHRADENVSIDLMKKFAKVYALMIAESTCAIP